MEDVGEFKILLTTEKGFCLVDEFLELRVQLCRVDVLVGQMFAVLCLFLFYEQK